jgi:Ca2+-binding EF-hand superfamily protein
MDILNAIDPTTCTEIGILEDCIRRAFDRIDKTKNGKLTRNELAVMLGSLTEDNRSVRKETANRVVKTNDIKGDHTLDREEFRMLVINKLTDRNIQPAITSLRHMIDA